jgi:hypothetical protein
MNVFEQIYEFNKLLETVSPEFKTTEKPDTDTIVTVLNIAQLRYLYAKYLNKQTAAENIEYLQQRADDLRNLIQREVLTAVTVSTGPLANIAYTADLSTTAFPYLYYLRSDSLVTRTVAPPIVTGEWVANIIARSYEDIDRVTTTAYNKPNLRQPIVALEASQKMLIVVDSYTTIDTSASTGIGLTYLRQPKYMTVGTPDSNTVNTCELAWHTHEEIVRSALDIYLKEYKFMLTSKQAKA